MGVIVRGCGSSRRGGAAAFQTDRDHPELLGRIAKVRLAKALKARGYALDGWDWGALDARTADRARDRIGGADPAAALGDGPARPSGNLTEEEFNLILEPKDSWGKFDPEEDRRRCEKWRFLIRSPV